MGHHVTVCHHGCCDETSPHATGKGDQLYPANPTPDLLPITSTSLGAHNSSDPDKPFLHGAACMTGEVEDISLLHTRACKTVCMRYMMTEELSYAPLHTGIRPLSACVARSRSDSA